VPSKAAFLPDADSIINLHSLGLIDALCSALQAGIIEAHCTNYVWEHELAHLQVIRGRLTSVGLQVHTLAPSSPAGQTFKQMLRERGNLGRNSKGENQLVAFARHAGFSVTLVARDEGARRIASDHHIPAMDIATFLKLCLKPLHAMPSRPGITLKRVMADPGVTLVSIR
jgi:hypothetical protein